MSDFTFGDVDEVKIAVSMFPDLDRADLFPELGSGDSFPPIPSNPTSQAPHDLGWSDFATPAVKVTGDEDIEAFEAQFPQLESQPPTQIFSAPSAPLVPKDTVPTPYAPRPQVSSYAVTPILSQSLPEEDEPQVIRDWREKQAAEIKARDEASAARRQATISKAERAIDDFYEGYTAKRTGIIKQNKEEEAAFLAALADLLTTGTTWSRICELIELQNSQSKSLARTGPGTTDLTRYKEVLLRLRREGGNAPGAAGY